MITREESERLREQLLTVLEEDPHNTERLLERLRAITRETGINAFAAVLMILTRLAFEDGEARRHWEAILAHRERLSQAVRRDVGVRVALLDYFVNVNRRVVQPTLIDLNMMETGDRFKASDRLTGLANERGFRNSLHTELRRAKRYGKHVSVVLFDLDDFAGVNDRVGNLLGDRMLGEVAILLRNKVRDIDLAARPGEDELALVLPETDREGALLVAERFRIEVETHSARREVGGQALNLTVSGGVAAYPEDATGSETIVERAAQALYQAKASGKNRVQAYRPERRRYFRFDLEPGRFEIEVLTPKEVGRARPRNLSRNGILFASPEPLEVGEEIEIRLAERPGSTPSPMRIRGSVVRLEEIPAPADQGPDAPPADDRFEVGVAFDLDWSGGEKTLSDFLEEVRSARSESPP